MQHNLRHGVRLVVAMAFATACLTSCIDEDLSECGKDYTIDYTVRQTTDASAQLQRDLSTTAERELAAILQQPLQRVFATSVADIDMAFFGKADANLVQQEQHQMDAAHAQYTVYLKVADYRNLAVANVQTEPLLTADATSVMAESAICQQVADTIDTHTAGVFTSRLNMMAAGGQAYHADMYMVNCASCLVLDPGTIPVESVTGYVDDMADTFLANDSIYQFAHHTVTRCTTMSAAGQYALYAATMPSADVPTAHITASGATEQAAWRIGVVVRVGGKYTKTTLYIPDPLKAGTLRIIKAKINNRGEVVPTLHNVGVDIELDWKPGGNHDIEI